MDFEHIRKSYDERFTLIILVNDYFIILGRNYLHSKLVFEDKIGVKIDINYVNCFSSFSYFNLGYFDF